MPSELVTANVKSRCGLYISERVIDKKRLLSADLSTLLSNVKDFLTRL